MSGWKPAPPRPWQIRKQRAAVNAVLALIDEHRQVAEMYAAHSAEAKRNAARLSRRGRWVQARRERDRAARASRTARERISLTHYIVEALTAAWDQWDEYPDDDPEQEGM